jgi:hypothetical protein
MIKKNPLNMSTSPRDQGKQAFHQGLLPNACPYAKHSMNWWDWIDGFVWEQIHHRHSGKSEDSENPASSAITISSSEKSQSRH